MDQPTAPPTFTEDTCDKMMIDGCTFVDSGDGLYTCVGLHITSSLHNDNNDIFIGVCVTRVTVNIRCFICCSLVKNEGSI